MNAEKDSSKNIRVVVLVLYGLVAFTFLFFDIKNLESVLNQSFIEFIPMKELEMQFRVIVVYLVILLLDTLVATYYFYVQKPKFELHDLNK